MRTLGRYLSVALPVALLCACYGTKGDRHLLPEFEKPAGSEVYLDSKEKRELPPRKNGGEDGDAISVRVMFMGEVDSQDVVPGESDPKKKVYMGRKVIAGKKGADGEEKFEPFYFTLDTDNNDHIYKFKRGDMIKIRGIARRVSKAGKRTLHVIAHEVKKVPPRSSKKSATDPEL